MKRKELYARSEQLLKGLRKLLTKNKELQLKTDLKSLYIVRDAEVQKHLINFEEKLSVNSFKIGILYAKEGQNEAEMYNNVVGSSEYDEFLTILGKDIKLKDWDKYSGGLTTNSTTKLHSYYTCFRGHEIMFHVSTLLPYKKPQGEYGEQWERKSYIGNDVSVIVFMKARVLFLQQCFNLSIIMFLRLYNQLKLRGVR